MRANYERSFDEVSKKIFDQLNLMKNNIDNILQLNPHEDFQPEQHVSKKQRKYKAYDYRIPTEKINNFFNLSENICNQINIILTELFSDEFKENYNKEKVLEALNQLIPSLDKLVYHLKIRLHYYGGIPDPRARFSDLRENIIGFSNLLKNFDGNLNKKIFDVTSRFDKWLLKKIMKEQYEYDYLEADNKYKKVGISQIDYLGEKNKNSEFGVISITNEVIKPGTILCAYRGEIKKEKDVIDDSRYCARFFCGKSNETEAYVIDGRKKRNIGSFVNHSEIPNARLAASSSEQSIKIVALKEINPGEQVLIDYGVKYTLDEKIILNPNDSYFSMEELYNTFSEFYQKEITTIMIDDKEYFFRLPDLNTISEKLKNMPLYPVVDLPILHLNANESILDINEQRNFTLLIYFAIVNDIESMKKLLNHHPNINHQDRLTGNTALYFAIFYKREEIIELLLENNASTDLSNCLGESPLTYAKKYNLNLFNIIKEKQKNRKNEDVSGFSARRLGMETSQ